MTLNGLSCFQCFGRRSRKPSSKVIYTPYNRPWTWKPLQRAYKQKFIQQVQLTRMAEQSRSEAILRNLASDLLTEEQCFQFKQALHHFRVSHSVTTLIQQLKPMIDTTQKLLLLVELSSRLPKKLQEDFHRLCCLQYPNYDTYLRLFTNDNPAQEMPRVVGRDTAGRYKILSRGSEKKIYVKYNSLRNAYELHSQPGTSVTSGIYSQGDEYNSDDEESFKSDQGYQTPTYLKGKKVCRVFLKRRDDGSLGLGIIGGKEFGKEITINVIEQGSPAASQGLQVGDKILEVNGHSFTEFTHAEAVMVMRNAWNLIMMVEKADHQAKFIWPEQSKHHTEEHELVIFPSLSGKLGCTTQRLRNRTLIVKEVDDGSPAAKAGLQVADRVIKVDGINVGELTEKQILMLTNAKRLILVVRREVLDIEQGDHGNQRSTGVHGTVSSSNSGGIPPEKQRRVGDKAGEQIRSQQGRDRSAESRYSDPREKENYQQGLRTPASERRYVDDGPEHLVYGNKSGKDGGNWVLSPKPREHRYTQKKDMTTRDQQNTPFHPRTYSDGQYELRSRHALKDGLIQNGGIARYVRNKSNNPHKSPGSIRHIHNDDKVIQAIQAGLEKRQRAIRLALYQMTDPADYEWEI